MTTHTLKATDTSGTALEATFDAEGGMNLVSYRRGEVEVIAQDTRSLFDERKAGLGALIGPHFHRRNPATLPPLPAEDLFPHISAQKAAGVQDVFSHGIARYVPWRAESDGSSIHAEISGKDEYKGSTLADLEGQDFWMALDAHLGSEGLNIKLSVRSDTDSLVGLHYYYALPQGGTVVSEVADKYRVDGDLQPIPDSWRHEGSQTLQFDLSQEADYGFQPGNDPRQGTILLNTPSYCLRTAYKCVCAENSWQLWHPKEGGFVCIEPMSAANPRKPQLTVSSLRVNLQIQDPENR